jgi:protein TonB
MIAGVSVPSARAAVRQLAERVVQEATRIFSEPEPEIRVEPSRIEAQEPTPPAPEPRAEVVVSPVDASEDVETSQPDFPTIPNVSITFPEIASRQEAAEIVASHYPLDLQEAGVEGTVKLQFWVDAQGNAENIEVRESSGSQRLDYAAVRSVSEIRFNPATRNGVGVGTWVEVEVHFFALTGMGIIGSDSTDSGT